MWNCHPDRAMEACPEERRVREWRDLTGVAACSSPVTHLETLGNLCDPVVINPRGSHAVDEDRIPSRIPTGFRNTARMRSAP